MTLFARDTAWQRACTARRGRLISPIRARRCTIGARSLSQVKRDLLRSEKESRFLLTDVVGGASKWAVVHGELVQQSSAQVDLRTDSERGGLLLFEPGRDWRQVL